VTVRRGRFSDGALRGAFLGVPAAARAAGRAAGRTGELRGTAAFRPATFRAAVLRAVTFRFDDFVVAPVRAVLRALVVRPPAFRAPCRPAGFRVDFPAERAPPRAVLRADDLDRLLDDALRLAMSVILVYLP
jgi:hypothetical protein